MSALWSSGPAVHPGAIVLFVDATYIPFAAWTAAGLMREGAAERADIVVLSPDREGLEQAVAAVPGLRAVQIADSFAPYGFADVPEDFPKRSFLNLFAPHVFAGDYRRLILCDADYVIGSDDMPRLLDLEMKAYPLAAMRDIVGLTPELAAENEKRYFEPAGIKPSTPYLNGGFQVIEVAPYLAEEVGEAALASTLARGGPRWLGDQRALNAVLRGDWMELSPNCNWAAVWPGQTPAAGAVARRRLTPCGLHLLGAAKPWSDIRPGRIDPDIAEAMAAFFAPTPWAGLIPARDWTRNRARIAEAEAACTDPAALFLPEVLAYLRRDFEDVAQGLAPGYGGSRLL